MPTAYCFTPDRAFFAPAVRAIASLIEAEPGVARDIFLICEPGDALAWLRPARPQRCESTFISSRSISPASIPS